MTKLETERLYFRELEISDDEKLFELDSDNEVHKYLEKTVESIEECREIIIKIRKQYETNGTGRMAVIIKETNEFIGWAGLKIEKDVNGNKSFYDIGYRFIKKYWGKGYATEATQFFINYGFNTMKIDKICAYATKENIGSRRVLEKSGLKFTEMFKGDDGNDEAWYEINNPNYN